MQLDIGKFRGSQKQQEMEKAARLKRRVKGPADWDPSASNERDLDRHPIPIYKRKFVNEKPNFRIYDDDAVSILIACQPVNGAISMLYDQCSYEHHNKFKR
jgi:hypothetical protein